MTMKRLLLMFALVIACYGGLGLRFEGGVSPAGKDVRIASNIIYSEVLTGYTIGGFYAEIDNGVGLLGLYKESCYMLKIASRLQFYASYLKGIGYLSGTDRGCIVAGCSAELRYSYFGLLANYTLASYVKNTVQFTVSQVYLGISLTKYFY